MSKGDPMCLKVILFDLDGTLLPMDQELFTKEYFRRLIDKVRPHGYDAHKLIEATWAGIAAEAKNNGMQSNKIVFWKTASKVYGVDLESDMSIFDEYYEKDFNEIQKVCGCNPDAHKSISILKQQGFRIALATNPIFPKVATEHRIRWAGLETKDFEWISTYENSSFAKPNPEYYIDLARKLNVNPDECLMIGNDVREDMIAEKIGMKVFLLTDCLINKDNEDISAYPNGNFEDMIMYINHHVKEGNYESDC